MDEETGWVILQASLDYELMRRFTLTVLARDGGGEETTGRIRVNVLDVNDNAPLFQKEAYVGSLRENEQAVQPVARVRVRTHFKVSGHSSVMTKTKMTGKHRVQRNSGIGFKRKDISSTLTSSVSDSHNTLPHFVCTERCLHRCAGHQSLPPRKQTHTGAVVTNGSAVLLIASSRERLVVSPAA